MYFFHNPLFGVSQLDLDVFALHLLSISLDNSVIKCYIKFVIANFNLCLCSMIYTIVLAKEMITMGQVAIKEEEIFTYQDYILFPDNGKRYQIIDGEIYMSPAPIPYHQKILANLEDILRQFVKTNKLGVVFFAPCDVLLSDVDVVQPDIFFISTERMGIIKDKYIEGAPDLVIEITSPYTKKLDKIQKKRLYEIYKVAEYWIVDVDKKTLEVFSLKDNTYKTIAVHKEEDVVASVLMKGLKFNLQEIF